MNTLFTRLTLEESKLYTKICTLGAGTALPVFMLPSEFMRLIGVIYHDTGLWRDIEKNRPQTWEKINPKNDYFDIPMSWFTESMEVESGEEIDLLRTADRQIPDFVTYLKCLSELHKRRRKYALILKAQPIPTMVQVSPRSLVEYGTLNSEALASWLTWRKFFYDLDNRSAQETGYLFEPILAAAIGGEPKSAKAKVVCRSTDRTKGRQVDCWKLIPGGRPLAYEFKLRVTIAASGQGRFAEEVQFAEDCATSGATPVLVVLDPTPNARLSDLRSAYERKGGHAYIGDEAWAHLETEAGRVMSQFIEKYVRRPVTEISSYERIGDDGIRRFALLDLAASASNGELLLKLGQFERRIARAENTALSEGSADEDGESGAEGGALS